VKRTILPLALTLVFLAPALAQRSHPSGGYPPGRGPGSDPGDSRKLSAKLLAGKIFIHRFLPLSF
jgi:hypothetical protein